MNIEATPRIELPLWANVVLLLLVGFAFGFIIRDFIQVYRDNKEKK